MKINLLTISAVMFIGLGIGILISKIVDEKIMRKLVAFLWSKVYRNILQIILPVQETNRRKRVFFSKCKRSTRGFK